jgi:hypothetical protein
MLAPTPETIVAAFQPRLVKRSMGMRGSLSFLKDSQRTKATRARKPTTIDAITCAEAQGCTPPPQLRPSIKTS